MKPSVDMTGKLMSRYLPWRDTLHADYGDVVKIIS